MERFFIDTPLKSKKRWGMTQFLRDLKIGDYFFVSTHADRVAIAGLARIGGMKVVTQKEGDRFLVVKTLDVQQFDKERKGDGRKSLEM